MSAVLVYVTTRDAASAHRIARDLLEQHLIACANILDGATSLYRWQGQVCEEREAVLIAKTTPQRVDAVVAAVTAIHDYDCPCVVTLPISGGNPGFLAWIDQETSPQ